MKRLFALILALVMCLGLCACGSSESEPEASKFVGTYEAPPHSVSSKELEIKPDGTYYFTNYDRESERKGSGVSSYFVYRYEFIEEHGTWEEVDGFLCLTGTSHTTKYTPWLQNASTDDPIVDTRTSTYCSLDGEQYELKGKLLYDSEGETAFQLKS